MVKILPKDSTKRLAPGLTIQEFKCKCSYESCRMTIVEQDLIKAFTKFRKLVRVRLTINSGYRCPQHNYDVSGRPLSRHQLGFAIDISLKSLDHLSNSDIEFAAKEAGFTYIKFYKTFVHLDVRATKE